MTTITRQIVGYDPDTERVVFEYYIPPSKWDDILSLVHNNEQDPCHIDNYPIDISLANDIMGLMDHRVAQNLKYFLECEVSD
jgi:hypothetical protein